VAAGREVEFPRPDCPSCAGPLVFWSGYRRHVRAAGRCVRIFIPRLRCGPCAVSHALLPSFVLAWRLDTAGLPGWAGLGAWRFASAVTGGTLLAANTTSPFLIVGRRRFMPPVPP
jgi:hypothetical protein